MTEHETVVTGIKLASVWAAVGITSWSDVAAFFAALYSVILVGEWVWKRAIRPFAESKGWLKASGTGTTP